LSVGGRAFRWKSAWSGALIAALCLAAFSLIGGVAAARSQSLEYPVKAAYLPKFAPFVDWPASAFAAPDSAFVICVVGPDPFGSLLDKAVVGQKIGEHPVVVRRIAAASRDCHVLYLGQLNGQQVKEALKAVRGAPVLTVTDGARQPAHGVVHFTIKDNRVRFAIDDQAAADNGLSISSKLMSLALSVRRRA
jgi:hypothetical protein